MRVTIRGRQCSPFPARDSEPGVDDPGDLILGSVALQLAFPALPAGPPVVPLIGRGPRVAAAECVLVTLETVTADGVFPAGHRFEVSWLHAFSDPTQMVQVETGRDRAFRQLVRVTVSHYHPPSDPDARVAAAVARLPRRHQAPRRQPLRGGLLDAPAPEGIRVPERPWFRLPGVETRGPRGVRVDRPSPRHGDYSRRRPNQSQTAQPSTIPPRSLADLRPPLCWD